jgi:hypothetical protein
MAADLATRDDRPDGVPRQLEESAELEDVPAAVVCARCGYADCPGCASELDEPTHASKVVAIVPWERPGLGLGVRLWQTAKLATTGADSFFGALPEGEVLPAARFALTAELCAVTGLCLVAVPFVLALAPMLLEVLWLDDVLRQKVACALGLGIPCTALVMVLLHAVHGASLEYGVRRCGGKSRRDRGLRFGFYACGWDLVTLPLGLLILAVTDNARAAMRALPLGLTVPGHAALAYLRRVHQLDDEAARRAARLGGRLAGGLLLLLLGVGSAVVLIALGP